MYTTHNRSYPLIVNYFGIFFLPPLPRFLLFFLPFSWLPFVFGAMFVVSPSNPRQKYGYSYSVSFYYCRYTISAILPSYRFLSCSFHQSTLWSGGFWLVFMPHTYWVQEYIAAWNAETASKKWNEKLSWLMCG